MYRSKDSIAEQPMPDPSHPDAWTRPPSRWPWRRRSAVTRDIERILGDLRRGSKVALNLGCGDAPIPNIINCDLYSPLADVVADLCELSVFEDGSADCIESHHAIEHLPLADVPRAIAEWHRVLKPGGALVLTCPDLDAVTRLWLKSDRSLDSYEARMLFGSQEHQGMFHKSGYSSTTMRRLLSTCGFRVCWNHSPYPSRRTPSLLTVAQKL